MLNTPSAYATDAVECLMISELAGSIMTARQAGAPSEKLRRYIGSEVEVGSRIHNIYNILLTMAYSLPKHSTKEVQKGTIIGFRDGAFLKCMDIIDKK